MSDRNRLRIAQRRYQRRQAETRQARLELAATVAAARAAGVTVADICRTLDRSRPVVHALLREAEGQRLGPDES